MKLSLKLNSAWKRDLPPGDRRIWLLRTLALRRERVKTTTWHLELYWKRAFAGAAVVGVSLYLIAATALFLWWNRTPGNEVTWLDIATAPVRGEHLRQKRGDTAIAQALLRLRARDYVEAYYGLRVGLARSPGNVTGRVNLARMMAGSDPAGALTLLEDGLKYAPGDLELFRVLFGHLAATQSQNRLLDLTADLLAPAHTPALDAVARRFVANTRASLLLGAHDAAAAEALLAALPPGDETVEERRSTRLRVSALSALGRRDEARRLFATLKRVGMDELRTEAELAIDAGDATALESVLRRMKAMAPGQPIPGVFAFSAWHRMKRLTLRDLTEQEFFEFFATNDGALQLFAATAVNLDLPDAVRRAERIAVANRLSPFAFRVHLTELALRRGDFDEAFQRLREWEASIETLPPAQRFYPEFINRLTRASVAGGEQQITGLTSHLVEMRGRATAPMYELAVKVLGRAGHANAAREVVDLGLRIYPYADPLLRLRPGVVAAAERRAANEAAARVETGGAPELAAVEIPGTAALALERIDAALASGAFGSARDLLRAIRAARPAWLPKAAEDLAVRDVELTLLSQDATTSRAVLHAFLDRPRTEADLLRLARLGAQFAQRQRESEARVVRDELAALRPPAAVAQALRAIEISDDLAKTTQTAEATLAAIDRALSQGKADEARRVLEYVKQKSPAWLASSRADLGASEVRVWLALDRRPLALAAYKELAVRAGASRSLAFKLVRSLAAEGQIESARVLARETVRLLPDDKAAASLLREIEAPRPGE
ncbi:MAG: hypothetical protein KF715_16100 [Candidatus Didemnitutus sp.]|nr:hypothetical protein [Candidatus Didemnitutus sp.]